MTYPEHEKLNAVKDQSQAIGDFLDWLNSEKGIVLANYGNSDVAWLAPDGTAKERLLAEYFEIDLDKLEAEKRAMLQSSACVAANGTPQNRESQRNLDSDAPYPGMAAAFERHFGQSWTDRDWRGEASTWAAAWKAASDADREHCAKLCEDARPPAGRAWDEKQAACVEALTHVAATIRGQSLSTMTRTIHVGIHIESALKKSDQYLEGALIDDNGHVLSAGEVRQFLSEEAAKGYTIFCGCDNRREDGGCAGHEKP